MKFELSLNVLEKISEKGAMMVLETMKSSDLMTAKKVKGVATIVKYPWRTMAAGTSFAITDKSSIKLSSLKVMAYKMEKKLDKQFNVVEHDNCYEVGRIA